MIVRIPAKLHNGIHPVTALRVWSADQVARQNPRGVYVAFSIFMDSRRFSHPRWGGSPTIMPPRLCVVLRRRYKAIQIVESDS